MATVDVPFDEALLPDERALEWRARGRASNASLADVVAFKDALETFERPGIIEITGPSGSGKTRLALELLATCVAGGRHAVYIDADCRFPLLLFIHLLKKRQAQAGMPDSEKFTFVESCLRNLHLLRCTSSIELLSAIRRLQSSLPTSSMHFELIILDSASSFCWQDRVMDQDAYFQLLTAVALELRKLSSLSGAQVIATKIQPVQARTDREVLGRTWASAVKRRFFIQCIGDWLRIECDNGSTQRICWSCFSLAQSESSTCTCDPCE